MPFGTIWPGIGRIVLSTLAAALIGFVTWAILAVIYTIAFPTTGGIAARVSKS